MFSYGRLTRRLTRPQPMLKGSSSLGMVGVEERNMPPRLRVRTEWTSLKIISEPYVILTFRGDTAAVEVFEESTNSTYELLIGGIKSLANGVEPFRVANGGLFTGIYIKTNKESTDLTSPYIVGSPDPIPAGTNAEAYTEAETINSEDHLTREDKLWQRILRRYIY